MSPSRTEDSAGQRSALPPHPPAPTASHPTAAPATTPAPAVQTSPVIPDSGDASKNSDTSSPKAITRPATPPPSGGGALIAWVLFGAVCVGGWYSRAHWWPWIQARVARQPDKADGGGKPPVRAVPVVTTTVNRRNLDLYLNGLGTVTAFNAVTVKCRVEGELVKVAFTEGQMVKEGDLLAEIDPRPFERLLEQAEGQLARDKASLDLANLMLTRTGGLLKEQATTQQLYDQQLATVKQAEAVVKVDEALVDNAKLQLTYTKIISPITGRVGLRLVDRGNIVRANDTTGLAVITQLEPISVVFTIPQDEIPRVQRQMQKNSALMVDAFDRDFQTRLAVGKLTAIDNQVDATTGTLKLKATFDNKDHVLFPNQFVNARLLVETLEEAVVVSSSAIQRGPDSLYVYVVNSDDTVELREVEVGPAEGGDTSIVKGLTGGELVVTDGVDKLFPGAAVTRPSEKKLNGHRQAKDGATNSSPKALAGEKRPA